LIGTFDDDNKDFSATIWCGDVKFTYTHYNFLLPALLADDVYS